MSEINILYLYTYRPILYRHVYFSGFFSNLCCPMCEIKINICRLYISSMDKLKNTVYCRGIGHNGRDLCIDNLMIRADLLFPKTNGRWVMLDWIWSYIGIGLLARRPCRQRFLTNADLHRPYIIASICFRLSLMSVYYGLSSTSLMELKWSHNWENTVLLDVHMAFCIYCYKNNAMEDKHSQTSYLWTGNFHLLSFYG